MVGVSNRTSSSFSRDTRSLKGLEQWEGRVGDIDCSVAGC